MIFKLIILTFILGYECSSNNLYLSFKHRIAKRFVLHSNQWGRCTLRWAFRDPFHLFASKLEFKMAKNVIMNAFRTWEVESNGILHFIDVSQTTIGITNVQRPPRVDIDILFAYFAHGDAEKFDGVGGIVAHTTYPTHGLVHFDASERWIIGGTNKNDEMDVKQSFVDLRYVALHELGHALGLRHSTYNKSVMNPYYSEHASGSLHLSADDVSGLQELYSQCKKKLQFSKSMKDKRISIQHAP